MNRRGFAGVALAGVGSLFFPQKVKADSDSFELDGCLLQLITPAVADWNRDCNGNRWINKALVGTWMITYPNMLRACWMFIWANFCSQFMIYVLPGSYNLPY